MKHAAAKAFRQTLKANARNRAAIGRLKDFRKRALRAAASKDTKGAVEAVRLFGKAADKAVQKGIIKKNAGARLKSRLAVAIHRAVA